MSDAAKRTTCRTHLVLPDRFNRDWRMADPVCNGLKSGEEFHTSTPMKSVTCVKCRALVKRLYKQMTGVS